MMGGKMGLGWQGQCARRRPRLLLGLLGLLGQRQRPP